MRCPECGVETGGPGPFCAVCGTYLATAPPLPADAANGVQPVTHSIKGSRR